MRVPRRFSAALRRDSCTVGTEPNVGQSRRLRTWRSIAVTAGRSRSARPLGEGPAAKVAGAGAGADTGPRLSYSLSRCERTRCLQPRVNPSRMADSKSIRNLREVVYGSPSSSSGDEAPAAAGPTSAVVRTMASSIYEELERMIKNYGDGVVTALVPQLITVLEYWEKTVKEKHGVQLELDLQRADLAQLLKQFEKERQLRRAADQMLLETQDAFEEERKVMIDKLSSLEKNFKLMELKSKLQADQSQRFEEKESEMRKEYEKLHSRYSELLKNYTDYVDRTKAFAADRTELRSVASSTEVSSRINHSATSSTVAANLSQSPETAEPRSPSADGLAVSLVRVSLQAEMLEATASSAKIAADPAAAIGADRTGNNDKMPAPPAAAAAVVVPSFGPLSSPPLPPIEPLPFELEPDPDSEVDGPASDNASELTGSRSESPSEDFSSRYDYGVSREFDKLIKENQELVEMKNALNTVKNDLISQLEQKAAELELLRLDLAAARNTEVRLTEELRKAREALQAPKSDEDEDGETTSQRKRFTRVEMARVIYERNQYKERLVELQETVRWAEMARARSTSNGAPPHHDHGHQKKSGFWGFFSGLFVQREHKDDSSRGSCTTHYEMMDISGADASLVRLPSPSSSHETSLINSSEKIADFSFTREDIQGWNVPVSCPSDVGAADNTYRRPSNVPCILHCGPVDNDSQDITQMWCAASVTYRHSVCAKKDESYNCRSLNATCEKDCSSKENVTPSEISKSHVWICTTAGCDSKVLVFDLQSPSECTHSFRIKDQHILTISCTEMEAVISNKPQLAEILQPDSPDMTCSKDLDGLEYHPGQDSGLEHNYKHGYSNSLMWLAALSGWIYFYVPGDGGAEPKLVASSLLPASVLCFVQSTNRMCAGLANGTVAVFSRNSERLWNTETSDLLELDKEHFPVRCATTVSENCVWFGCGDNIYVVDVSVLRLDAVVQVLPEKPGRQVRCLRFLRGGVWISRRLDSVLKLYDSSTFVNLQEVDFDTFLLPLSGSCLSIKNTRITALNVTDDRLWIGTNNGVIVSVLLTRDAALRLSEHDLQYRQQPNVSRPSGDNDANRRVSHNIMEFVDMSGYQKADLPFCSAFNAQVSYHGHQAAVKFIIDSKVGPCSYILSGGDGAIDFRCAKATNIGSADSVTSTGHLILWRL